MRNNFVKCLNFVLSHEGGFSNHKSDPGGATMKGVTLLTFQKTFGRGKTVEDLKNINNVQLQSIYRDGYWDKCNCNGLPVGVDYAVFDAAVNSGQSKSAKWLQKAVGAIQDGIIGKQTLAKAREADSKETINRICLYRLEFMQQLSTWNVFGKGWQKRVDAVRIDAMEMVDNINGT